MPLNTDEQILEIFKILSKLEQRLDDIDKKIDRSEELEKRVRSLENFKYYLMGVAAVIGGIVGFIAGKI